MGANIINIPNTSNTVKITAPNRLVITAPGPQGPIGPTGVAGVHASTHIKDGSDEIDGDQIDIDWNPTNYTPTTSPSEATSLDHLTAHLSGIDSALLTSGFTTTTGTTTTSGADSLELTGVLADDAVHYITATFLGVEQSGTNAWLYEVDGFFQRSGGTLSRLSADTDAKHQAVDVMAAPPIPTFVANNITKKIDAQLVGQAATTIKWAVVWRVHNLTNT